MTITTSSKLTGLGIREIDSDHEILARMVGEIHDSLHSRVYNDYIRDRAVRLFRFADEHFTREDTLMDMLAPEKYGEHINSHKKLHMTFLGQIAGMSNRLSVAGESRAALARIADTLAEILEEMVTVDKDMVRFLFAEGIARPDHH
jgi:hemerythrin-like metal-binding protein